MSAGKVMVTQALEDVMGLDQGLVYTDASGPLLMGKEKGYTQERQAPASLSAPDCVVSACTVGSNP